MKIIVANLSIIYNKNNESRNITKKDFIIHISETIFLIMSNNSINPIIGIRNYSNIYTDENKLIIRDNNKKIDYTIIFHQKYNELEIDNQLSAYSSNILRKESDLKIDIINNFNTYFPNLKILKEEYITPYGNIDILAVDNNGYYHLIELKKRSTDINTIDQIVKYGKYFEENGHNIYLYVLGIKNNKKNIQYALNNNVKIIEE